MSERIRKDLKVGDLVGIGWIGILQRPFIAVIKKIHTHHIMQGDDEPCYTVFLPANGNETFVSHRNLKPISYKTDKKCP